MVANPISKSWTEILEKNEAENKSCGKSLSICFVAVTALLLSLYQWPLKWYISGTPILTICILLGSSQGYRVLPFIPLWSLIITINFAYSIATTSWLLYWCFAGACYPAILLTCIFQFNAAANFARRNLRRILRQLQFVNDKIAFFDIPALEIDTEVDGLLVIRGITFSLSSLSFIVHGIEVGIKLSDDMELAIQTEKVVVRLFRKIEIGDCYANIKGGAYEMTFGDMDARSQDSEGDAVMVANTPLLQIASKTGDKSRPPMVKMKEYMTNGTGMTDTSAETGFKSITQIPLVDDDETAVNHYQTTIAWIESTNFIQKSREKVSKRAKDAAEFRAKTEVASLNNTDIFDHTNENDLRAAICSSLHNKPSIPHPPQHSIKVTTLRGLSSPVVRTFMHRLPMLLRLLLNPISYFHPISICSITAAGSGKWITHILREQVFRGYSGSNSELARLEERVAAWLSDANFAVEVADITAIAQVPFISAFDISAFLSFGDVMAYRTLPKEVNLKQVIRLGGADATFAIPTFLLPHHEHLLPPIPDRVNKEEATSEMKNADGKPRVMQKARDLAQLVKDETNVKVSVHARLPACLDQELLNFIAALVKATKVVEMQRERDTSDSSSETNDEESEADAMSISSGKSSIKDGRRMKDFTHNLQNLHHGFKTSMKRVAVDGIINDRWIAKLVGKITKRLETARGDVGYSGDIPVALGPYRLPDGHVETHKLLA
jgi:hypothetical protein